MRLRTTTAICATMCATIAFPNVAMPQEPSCSGLIPPGGAYDRVRTYINIEKRDYLEEYTYIKNFGSHDEALSAGISLGVEVYGVPLAIGGQWDSTKKSEWRTNYEHRRKQDVMTDVTKLLATDLLNVEVVRIIAECIERQGLGYWSSLGIVDQCRFTISAGYVAPSLKPEKVLATLKVPDNAACDPFPTTALPPGGFTSACKRKNAGAVPLIVHSVTFGDKTRTVPAITKPAEPTIVEQKTVNTLSLNLSRGQAAINWGPFNCPDCQTLYGIPFSAPGPIVDMRYLGGSPSFVWPCPNGGKCGPIPTLFATPSGGSCMGSQLCLVWFLERNHGTAALHSVQVDWSETKRVCTANCRTSTLDETSEKVAYQTALELWNEVNSNGCANPKEVKPPQLKPNSLTTLAK